MEVPGPPNAKPWDDAHRLTSFQLAVVDAVAALERGELVTYGELAQELGRPGGGQAVANVLRSAPDLPWWRVVPGDGRLYRSHLAVQQPLLEAEGHVIDRHRRVHSGPTTSMGALRVGCSGWSYRDWRGTVYPTAAPARTWLALYAEQFDTVELNNTFYRLPDASAVDGWAAAAPPGFLFAVKVGQFGSHRMKLRDAASWLPRHLERIERLGVHLGPNLIQLPPRWKRNAARLDEMLDEAPSRLRWAVEVRDPTWLHDDVFSVLARHRAALCIHDLLPDHPWERTTSWTYVRFHGPRALEEKYRGRYGPRRLTAAATRLRQWRAEGTDLYAYFNNDYDGHAVADARWLRGRLEAPVSSRS